MTFVTGCVTTASIDQPKTTEGFKRLVFGRISIISEGKSLTWESCVYAKFQVCPDELAVLILPESASTPVRHKLAGDGSFFWNLPPGNYTISHFEWVKYGDPRITRSGRIWVDFSVPTNKEVVYVGTLTLTFFQNRYNILVEDEYEFALLKLQSQFPTLQTEPFKKLLWKEEAPKARYVTDVCAENWGITCTRTNRGITPINPECERLASPTRYNRGATSTNPECERLAFPLTDSLTPTLKWQPSSKIGMTYDVVIYEAITYRKALETNHFPGRIVDYKEGLEEPTYTVVAPLKPGTKYFWSVRLRDKDTVSEWSHLNYSFYKLFLVVFAESANNLLFNFSTP